MVDEFTFAALVSISGIWTFVFVRLSQDIIQFVGQW